MMCHRTGRWPIGIIGLGAESSLVRIRSPSPPQNKTTFIVLPRFSENLEGGQGDHQLSSPLAGVGKLRRYLVAKVPRHDHDVLRLGLGQVLHRVDGYMSTG